MTVAIEQGRFAISYRLFDHPYDRQFIRLKTMGYKFSKKAPDDGKHDLDQNPKCSDHKLRS